MRRIALLSVLLGLMAATCSSDHAGQHARSVAASDRVVPAPQQCSLEFVAGRRIAPTDAPPKALVCEGSDRRLWQVVVLRCADGVRLVHTINGWGLVGRPFHDGAILRNACVTG